MFSTLPPENSGSIVHVEGGSKHFSRPVPPIRIAAHFSNPLNDDESETETVSTIETLPPPDIIDASTGKQLDAFRLLLQNTFSATHERHCAGLPLPKELLQNVDISWVLRAPTSTLSPTPSPRQQQDPKGQETPLPSPNKMGGTQNSVGFGKGRKNLDTLFKNRREKILIDSPRSVMTLMKAGTNCSSLRVASDSISETRVKKTIVVLQHQYRQLTDALSQHCVIHYLNTGTKRQGVPVKRPLGFITPSAKLQLRSLSVERHRLQPDEDEDKPRPATMNPVTLGVHRRPRLSDEESDTPSLDVALLVKQNKVGETIPAFALLEQRRKQLRNPVPDQTSPGNKDKAGVTAYSPTIKRAKPRNLQRLLQHRDLLTADWGIKQQTLVSDAYQAGRLEELNQKRSAAKKDLSPTAVSAIRDQPQVRSSSVPPFRTEVANPAADTISQTSGMSRSGGVPEIKAQREITTEEKLRRKQHIEKKRRLQKELEEQRRQEFDGKVKHKDKLAAEAAERRQERRKEMMAIQTAKEKKVQDVNERMKRGDAYKSLQLVQRMEEEAERSLARGNIVAQEKKALQEEHRQRNLLEYETRQFVQKSTVRMDKIMCQQQTQARRRHDQNLKETSQARRNIGQKKLKEESRELLMNVLKNEDKLISHWKVLDELDLK